MGASRIRLAMGIIMVLGKPAPFVSAFVDAVDEAIRAHNPRYGMSIDDAVSHGGYGHFSCVGAIHTLGPSL